MKRFKVGTGFSIFIIFFGIALVDAVRSFDWLRTAFWIVIGFLFLLMDNYQKESGA